jgi:anaerobic selenocysteine-containing dehydrogenase
MEQADLALCLRPGTDGALACAVMHVLFRDNLADWDYLERYTDAPRELEAHLQTRGPEWASKITGLSIAEIEAFAHLVGQTKRSFFRLGYGFSRQRNGAVNMHAASCIAAVTGAWLLEGGGAFHNNGAIYGWKQTFHEAHDLRDADIRALDQCHIGRILKGDHHALQNGPPVTALFIQNTNPMSVAPEQSLVAEGFAREDLFTVVHEQFMTETAKMADIVLPATMFLEHDDIYSGGGHQYVEFAGKLIDAPGECRSNHDVICALADALGAQHPGFRMQPRELIETILKESGHPPLEILAKTNWHDVQPDFETAHYTKGFAWPDGKFRFKPDWPKVPYVKSGGKGVGLAGPWYDMPSFPDHWEVIEEADARHPFRLATSPARSFLNSTFNETPSARAREGRPEVLIHPDDAQALGLGDGDRVRIGNERGSLVLHAKYFAGVQRGVLVSEGIWPNEAFEEGRGINALTGADSPAPFGGAAFHDNKVWVKKA